MRIEHLLPHERVGKRRVAELKNEIRRDGVLKRPIAVHMLGGANKGKYMIIDGHHRVEALKSLGLTRAPASVVDYFDSRITVRSWRSGKVWDKRSVIRIATIGRLLEPKTTRHTIRIADVERSLHDNDVVEPEMDYPLEELK